MLIENYLDENLNVYNPPKSFQLETAEINVTQLKHHNSSKKEIGKALREVRSKYKGKKK